MNGKLDISRIRNVVERNILDNDRLQQKAEARKSDSHASSPRLEMDKTDSKTSNNNNNNNGNVDNNSLHHKDAKNDNFNHLDNEYGAVKNKKKKKKRKGDRGDMVPSSKALSDSKSDGFDSKNANSKVTNGSRFSCIDGPRIPKR